MVTDSGSEAKTNDDGLPGLRVCSFESRKGSEMRSLIERQGGIATIAPSMQEIPLDDNPAAFAFAELLFAGEIDVLILLTGVGTRALAAAIETRYERERFLEALGRCCVIVRGPKPAAVLREWKVRIDHLVAEPNTWRELLELVDARVPVQGKRVAVQEYGQPNEELYAGLTERGADVLRVPVYQWALPDDIGPLQDAIRRTIDGGFDVILFTSAHQLRNVLEIADTLGLREQWLTAARMCVVASIGPTASETLEMNGLPVDVEPEHPKMGHLVIAAARSSREILARKRGADRASG